MKLFLPNFLHLPIPFPLLDQNISVAYMSIYSLFTAFTFLSLSLFHLVLNSCGRKDTKITYRTVRISPPQWPRGLRHEPSSPGRTLGSWVRIPLEAWMSVCVYSVFVLFFVLVAALRLTDPPSKESYRLCRD
jgi:hypothetical protein